MSNGKVENRGFQPVSKSPTKLSNAPTKVHQNGYQPTASQPAKNPTPPKGSNSEDA